jgi:hypothetical protein
MTATWTSGRCAEVRVGDHVTRYVRRGSGSPVVVVGANADQNGVWASLVNALAGNHRLVIPQLPQSESDVASWLRSFIEGIGLSSVALIAGGDARVPAVSLAAADDFTVRKLVLIADGESHDGNGTSLDSEASMSDPSRTLQVAANWQPGEAVERVQRFIG